MGRKSSREGTRVYTQLIHFAAPWELTPHCKATTHQQKLIMIQKSQGSLAICSHLAKISPQKLAEQGLFHNGSTHICLMLKPSSLKAGVISLTASL